MSAYTLKRLDEVRDGGPDVGALQGHEIRVATADYDAEAVGFTDHRMAPRLRPDFAHRHQHA